MIRTVAVIALTVSTLTIPTASLAGDDFPVCRAPFSDLLSPKTYSAYPVSGSARAIKPARPDVTRGRAHLFRTAIRQGAQQGPNFAGHFTIIRIGCGAGTVCPAIADASTGKVYFPEALKSATHLLADTGRIEISRLNFRRDSNLLIVIGTVNEQPQGYGMYHFRWNAGQLHLLKFVPAAKLCGWPPSTRY